MNVFLEKKEFVTIINALKNIDEFHSGLEKLFNKHNVDGYFYPPDCTDSVMLLLHKIYGKKDFDEYISKFVFDLDYGKKCKSTKCTEKEITVCDKNGNNVKLLTSDILYDVLVGNEVKQSSENMV